MGWETCGQFSHFLAALRSSMIGSVKVSGAVAKTRREPFHAYWSDMILSDSVPFRQVADFNSPNSSPFPVSSRFSGEIIGLERGFHIWGSSERWSMDDKSEIWKCRSEWFICLGIVHRYKSPQFYEAITLQFFFSLIVPLQGVSL